MDDRPSVPISKPNREGRPLRRRGISFNVLPIREEPTPVDPSPTPILVDYSSIRERKQLNLSDFLHSDNPVTFFLFTFWRTLRLFGRLFVLPFVTIKYLYLLMLKVYGVRRSTTSTITTTDLFSISSSHSSTSQQRPIVSILRLIDYFITQLTKLPDTIGRIISSITEHIDGTVLKSFNLIDSSTSYRITNTYAMFKNLIIKENSHLNSKVKR